MLQLVFLGAALGGATSLLTSTLCDKNKTESQYSPHQKSAGNLDAGQIAKRLNSYYCKAQAISTKCHEIVSSSGELIVTPIPLSDDNFFQKAASLPGRGGNRYRRSWGESEMRQLKEEAKELYGRYREVFEQANHRAVQKGASPVDLSALTFSGNSPAIDNSPASCNREREFWELTDNIQAFIEKSCKAAKQLIDILEGKRKDKKLKVISG